MKTIERSMDEFEKGMAKNPLDYNRIFSSAIVCILFYGKGGLKYNSIKIDHSLEKQKAFERNQNQGEGNVIKI